MDYLFAIVVMLIVFTEFDIYLKMLNNLKWNGPFAFAEIAANYSSDAAFKARHTFGYKSWLVTACVLAWFIYTLWFTPFAILLGCISRYVLCYLLHKELKRLDI